MARELDKDIFDAVSKDIGNQTIADYYINKANLKLQSDPNYANNLFKLQSARNQLDNNTNALVSNIQQSQEQLVDANYAARQKQAASGVGNKGLGALNAVNTKSNDLETARSIAQTATSNRQTWDSINLFNSSLQATLGQNIYADMVNDRKQGNLGWVGNNGPKINGQEVSGDAWWHAENTLKDQSIQGQDPITEDDRKESEKHRA